MFVQLETYDPTTMLQPKQRPEDARQDAGKFAANLTLAKGTLIAKRTATGELEAYDDSDTAGLGVAVGILMYSIKTDSSGRVYFSDSTDPSVINVPHALAPYWQSGIFDTADLTGYDANGLADLNGKVLANGYISIP